MPRILGLDYGKKRIGLAISDELQIVSSPLTVLHNNSSFIAELKKICGSYNVAKIVIGYPYSKKYRQAACEVMEFSEKIKVNTDIEIDFQNEEYSTVFSLSLLKSMGFNEKKIKASLDKFAAQKILEDYIKTHPKKE
jgi:putative Holliday junction resolvase